MKANYRTPIVAVLGHVDVGKTSFLDKVRSTNLAAKEPGLITQHIGATEIPLSLIKEIAGSLIQKFGFNLTIPGLLFIDTPGHEAFTNLRERGSSIADLAVLIVDVNKGLQEQTKEAITILRSYKVPFVVCLSKIDLVEGYDSQHGSFLANHAQQNASAQKRLDEKLYRVVGQLFENGFQSERFDRVQDITKEIGIVPVSAQTGEGLPETLVFLSGIAQKFLEKNLKIQDDGPAKGTVLEVRDEKGMGTTVDVILYDGHLCVGDSFVVAGKNGVIQTKVRALLRPNTITDIRMNEKWIQVKEIHAAAGIKVSAPHLEDALAGSPFLAVTDGREIAQIENEVNQLKIDSQNIGVILKTDTLGSLEALVKLFQTHAIPIKRADVGEITKRDIMEAAAIQGKDKYAGVIFAFNTAFPESLRKDDELANVKVFEHNIVYALTEEYARWKEEEKQKDQESLLSQVVFPCQFQLLPGHIFRNSKPAVVGVKIIEGKLRTNAFLQNEKGEKIGKVLNIQVDGKTVSEALSGQEVAVSISDVVIGRGLFENDVLFTRIPESMLPLLNKITLTPDEKELLDKITALQSILDNNSGGINT
ncbi:MAG: translation initiation factor IF-2 [Candidatus Diapherotrites archaeon]